MKPFTMARFGLLFTLLVWTSLLLAQSAEPTSFSADISNAQPLKVTEKEPYHGPAYRIPYFSGGSRELVEYIQAAIQYPEVAREYAVEGEVLVEFSLDEAGKIQRPMIIESPGFGLGEEGLRVVKTMPNWEPALVNGRPAPSKKMRLAIVFRLY